jgi:hypothetical protein
MSHRRVDGRGQYGNEGGSSLGGKRRTDEEGRAASPRIYKEVPRPSRGLALAATKRSLTIINREIYLRYLPIYIFIRV